MRQGLLATSLSVVEFLPTLSIDKILYHRRCVRDGAWSVGGMTLTRETAIFNSERKNLATTLMKNLYTFLRAYSLSSLL